MGEGLKRAFAAARATRYPTVPPRLRLPETCSGCAHYDGDGFCALPEDDKAITGYIAQADQVVCAKWTRKDEGE